MEKKSFAGLLAADKRVTEHLQPDAIRELINPVGYIGLCAEMAHEAAKRARAASSE